MNQSFCVILISCTTGEVTYVRGGALLPNTQEIYDFWVANVNLVITANSPLFPDPTYIVDSVCTVPPDSIEPGSPCLTCFQNGLSLFPDNVTVLGYTPCLPTNSTNGYFLVNCNYDITEATLQTTDISSLFGPDKVLFTFQDLYFYKNQVVKISEYDTNCYQVFYQTDGNFFDYTADTDYTILDAFEDCACCLPDVPEVFVRTQQKPFKDFTRITETECELRTIEKFTVNYYNYFRQLKYGLQNCCGDHDLDKLWMDMQMVTYNRMKNGTCESPSEEIVVDCPISPLA